MTGAEESPLAPSVDTTGPAIAAGADSRVSISARQLSSVEKTLALLDAFQSPQALLGITELAVRTGLPKSTTHRLISVLIERGFVGRFKNRYCLTDHVFELGNRASICRPKGLRERAVPFMTELHAEVQETIHLAVLRGTDVLYLEKIFGHGAPPSPTAVGMRRPAHATALGKALLAHSSPDLFDAMVNARLERYTRYTKTQPGMLHASLQAVRADGLATDFEESALGITCIAAPIFDSHTGAAIAAMSISASSARGDVRRLAPRLLRATRALSSRPVAC